MYKFCLFPRKTCKVLTYGNRYLRPQLFWRQRQKEPLRPGFQGELGNIVKKTLNRKIRKTGRSRGEKREREAGREYYKEKY